MLLIIIIIISYEPNSLLTFSVTYFSLINYKDYFTCVIAMASQTYINFFGGGGRGLLQSLLPLSDDRD